MKILKKTRGKEKDGNFFVNNLCQIEDKSCNF